MLMISPFYLIDAALKAQLKDGGWAWIVTELYQHAGYPIPDSELEKSGGVWRIIQGSRKRSSQWLVEELPRTRLFQFLPTSATKPHFRGQGASHSRVFIVYKR